MAQMKSIEAHGPLNNDARQMLRYLDRCLQACLDVIAWN